MLASRLGVAALIVIALSIFTGNRPFGRVHVMTADVSEAGADSEPKITIGPFTIDPNLSDEEIIRDGIAAIRQSEPPDEEEVAATEAEIEHQRRDLERDAEAMEIDGLEIARQLSAREIKKSDEAQPERLSESEIQNLVVERLLSVQNQMREEEGVSGSAPEAASPADLSSQRQPPPNDSAPSAEAPEPAPPQPAIPGGESGQSGLRRVEGNFSGKTLMGTDFRNQDLSGLDFSNARLTAAKFDGSDLTGANFSGAKIQGASFSDANLNGANLTNAQAQTAHFERASLIRADLSHANFAGAVLADADLRGAIMDSLNLNGVVMDRTRTGEAP